MDEIFVIDDQWKFLSSLAINLRFFDLGVFYLGISLAIKADWPQLKAKLLTAFSKVTDGNVPEG